MANKKRISKWFKVLKFGTIIATPAVFVLPLVNFDHTQKQSLVQKEIITNSRHIDLSSSTINNRETTQTTSNISIKTIDDPSLSLQERDEIRNFMKLVPSEISTKNQSNNEPNNIGFVPPPGNIFKLLKFSENVYDVSEQNKDNRPKVTNMSNATEGLGFKENPTTDYRPEHRDPNTPLSYLKKYTEKNNEGILVEKDMTETKLNELGVLVLRVDYTTKTNEKMSEFLTITGFNSELDKRFLSNNILLDGHEYRKSIPEIRDNDLISYPKFNSIVKPTTTKFISRENLPSEGKLNYKLQYDFDLPKIVGWNLEDQTEVNVIRNPRKDNGRYDVKNSYQQEFILTGFKKSSNMTTNQMIFIISMIIIVGVVIAIGTYGVSILTNKLRFRNAQ